MPISLTEMQHTFVVRYQPEGWVGEPFCFSCVLDEHACTIHPADERHPEDWVDARDELTAHLRTVGFKLGRWVDAGWGEIFGARRVLS